jgi:hypothetical protein
MAVQHERGCDGGADLGDQQRMRHQVADHHHDELVAAVAVKALARRKQRAQALRERHQQRIALDVPQRFVDVLEPVHIQEGHGHAVTRPGALLQQCGQFALELGAMRQAGQRIVVRQVLGLLFGLLQARLVREDADELLELPSVVAVGGDEQP